MERGIEKKEEKVPATFKHGQGVVSLAGFRQCIGGSEFDLFKMKFKSK